VTINAGSPAEALCKAEGLTPEEAMEESQSSGEIMEDSLIVGDGEVSPNYMSLEDGTIVYRLTDKED
jgi:hypothetical protein